MVRTTTVREVTSGRRSRTRSPSATRPLGGRPAVGPAVRASAVPPVRPPAVGARGWAPAGTAGRRAIVPVPTGGVTTLARAMGVGARHGPVTRPGTARKAAPTVLRVAAAARSTGMRAPGPKAGPVPRIVSVVRAVPTRPGTSGAANETSPQARPSVKVGPEGRRTEELRVGRTAAVLGPSGQRAVVRSEVGRPPPARTPGGREGGATRAAGPPAVGRRPVRQLGIPARSADRHGVVQEPVDQQALAPTLPNAPALRMTGRRSAGPRVVPAHRIAAVASRPGMTGEVVGTAAGAGPSVPTIRSGPSVATIGVGTKQQEIAPATRTGRRSAVTSRPISRVGTARQQVGGMRRHRRDVLEPRPDGRTATVVNVVRSGRPEDSGAIRMRRRSRG